MLDGEDEVERGMREGPTEEEWAETEDAAARLRTEQTNVKGCMVERDGEGERHLYASQTKWMRRKSKESTALKDHAPRPLLTSKLQQAPLSVALGEKGGSHLLVRVPACHTK